MLSEISQKDRYCMILLTEVSKVVKHLDAGAGEGGSGGLLFSKYEVSVMQDK